MATLCHVFGSYRSSYKYWKNVLENQTTDDLYYEVRYLSYIASDTVGLSKRHRHNCKPERPSDRPLV
ncbi:hypothetical protein BvCmsNSNP030_3325 [Escherichia coli]|nr:hypothetical protein BvCmsNSNP030_1655 [Escherichia coli]BCM48306.1 hypothetical protein BvCmsNSNP030_3325 [Escherichia coli]